MKTMLLVLTSVVNAQDFNNWTTESLNKFFVPPIGIAAGARPPAITRVHGKIKTVTFSPGLPMGAYEFQAKHGFLLISVFLLGPNADFTQDRDFMKILILLMTLIPTLAFANLGDTRAESEKRYGEGIPWGPDEEHSGIVAYHFNQAWPITVFEWYNAQGISESIKYFRTPPNTPITYDEVKVFVVENGLVDLKGWEYHGGNVCKGSDYVYEGKKYRYAVQGEIGNLFYTYTIGTPEGIAHLSN